MGLASFWRQVSFFAYFIFFWLIFCNFVNSQPEMWGDWPCALFSFFVSFRSHVQPVFCCCFYFPWGEKLTSVEIWDSVCAGLFFNVVFFMHPDKIRVFLFLCNIKKSFPVKEIIEAWH